MAVNPSPFGPCPQFELASGAPAVGNLLFFYSAGTTTKLNTFTNSTGATPNTNPLVLNSLGQPSTEIWFTNGSSYKIVYAPSTDTDPPTNPIRTWDNLRGINDTTLAASQSEWVLFGGAPTFVDATHITLTGNQTSTFEVNRRIKTTNTGGTIYSTITASVFTSLTTLTVVNDSGSIDSGISDISYGLLAYANNSFIAKQATNLKGGNSTTLLGSIPYQSNTDTTTLLAPNTTTTKKFLSQTGDGTNGAVPAYSVIGAGSLDGAQTGTAPIFGIRAWGFFNGATAGTNAPTAGGNVTSVTRNSAGDYSVIFATNLVDANFASDIIIDSSQAFAAGVSLQNNCWIYARALSGFSFRTGSYTGASNTINATDYTAVAFKVVR